MKVAITYNKDFDAVINKFGMQNKELYKPEIVQKVASALEKGGHNARIIDGNMNVVQELQEFMPRVTEGERMGMVFNMAYGIQGESRYTHLPSILEMLGIPYVGSSPAGHTLALDKVTTKIILQKNKIPTPNYWVVSTMDDDTSGIQFPAIVKPKMEAVSEGITVVHNNKELNNAIGNILSEFKQPALVEQFIPGREFCIGLLGNGDPESFPVLEIDLGKNPFAIQTAHNKHYAPFPKICPAKISDKLATQMVKASKEAFHALGLRDFARVDIRMDKDENIYVLEINSMASLGPTGSYVHAAEVAGYSYDRLVNKMLEVAAVRYFSDRLLPSGESPGSRKLPQSAKVRMFLRAKQTETERLLAKMVNINTHVRNVDGVNILGKLICQTLKPLGFAFKVIPKVEVGNVLFLTNNGDKKLDALFIAHLDTSVPFKKQNLYHETEHKLYGTGIWDSKGGIAVLISALRVLRYLRAIRKIRIGILLTTDNSLQGRVSSNDIIKISKKAKHIIGLRGSSLDGTIITSRSGAAMYNCEMNLNKPQTELDVANANVGFSHLLASLAKLSNESDRFVALRDVKMNSNIAPMFAHGEVSFSVRFNDPKQSEIIDREINKLAKNAHSHKVSVHISGTVRRNPMVRTKRTEELFNMVMEVGKKLDIRVQEEHRWSSSEICFADDNKARIDGLGSIGDNPHEDEDYILRHSMLDRSALLALLLNDLGR